MHATIFCNVCWMSWYQGLAGRPDKIVGGAVGWIRTKRAVRSAISTRAWTATSTDTSRPSGEEWIDRFVSKPSRGEGESVDGVDVVWTATDPDNGGRRVVIEKHELTSHRGIMTCRRGSKPT